MDLTSPSLWTALSRFVVGVILPAVFCTSVAGYLRSDIVKGVLYYSEQGQGKYPAGHVFIALKGRVHRLEYVRHVNGGLPDACYEPGAIWTATVRPLQWDIQHILKVECKGDFDELIHTSWTLVRNFLNRASADDGVSPEFFSRNGRSSATFDSFRTRVSASELSRYMTLGRKGLCLEVLGVENSGRVLIGAGSCIPIQGATAVFDVIRTSRGHRPLIDQIRFLQRAEYAKVQDTFSRPRSH
jgi:hypothetical protein